MAKLAGSTKKNLAVFVSEKIKKKNEKVQEAGSSLEDKMQILDSYSFVFNGALGALEAAGIEAGDSVAVQLALDSIESELDSIEKSLKLERALNGEEESGE